MTNLIKEAGVRNLLIDIPRPPLVVVPKSYRDTVVNRTFCAPMVKRNGIKDIHTAYIVPLKYFRRDSAQQVVVLLHLLN